MYVINNRISKKTLIAGCFDGVDSTMFFNLRFVLDLNMIHFGGKSPRFNDQERCSILSRPLWTKVG